VFPAPFGVLLRSCGFFLVVVTFYGVNIPATSGKVNKAKQLKAVLMPPWF
jgi:hypothetical protein